MLKSTRVILVVCITIRRGSGMVVWGSGDWKWGQGTGRGGCGLCREWCFRATHDRRVRLALHAKTRAGKRRSERAVHEGRLGSYSFHATWLSGSCMWAREPPSEFFFASKRINISSDTIHFFFQSGPEPPYPFVPPQQGRRHYMVLHQSTAITLPLLRTRIKRRTSQI